MKNIYILLALTTIIPLTQAQNNMKNKIIFAAEPFSKNPSEQKEFKEGANIYGRLILEGPVKNFCIKPDDYDAGKLNADAGAYHYYIVFFARPVDQEENMRSNVEIKLYIADADLEKTTIDFEIAPKESEVTSFYPSWSFMDELALTSSTYSYFGGKMDVVVQLKDKDYMNLNYDPKSLQPSGNLTMDFTNSDYRSQMDWKSSVEEILKKVKSKYIK